MNDDRSVRKFIDSLLKVLGIVLIAWFAVCKVLYIFVGDYCRGFFDGSLLAMTLVAAGLSLYTGITEYRSKTDC